MTDIGLLLALTRQSLAHARLAMLRAADVLGAGETAKGLRVRAELLEDMETGLAITACQAAVPVEARVRA